MYSSFVDIKETCKEKQYPLKAGTHFSSLYKQCVVSWSINYFRETFKIQTMRLVIVFTRWQKTALIMSVVDR